MHKRFFEMNAMMAQAPQLPMPTIPFPTAARRWSPEPPERQQRIKSLVEQSRPKLGPETFGEALDLAYGFLERFAHGDERGELLGRVLALRAEGERLIEASRQASREQMIGARDSLYQKCREADLAVTALVNSVGQERARLATLGEQVSFWSDKVNDAKNRPVGESAFPTRSEIEAYGKAVEEPTNVLQQWLVKGGECRRELADLELRLGQAKRNLQTLVSQLEQLDGQLANVERQNPLGLVIPAEYF